MKLSSVKVLFSTELVAPDHGALARDRRGRRRISTGAPRLVESPTDRQARVAADAWAGLVAAVQGAARARVDLLRGRDGGELVACPWGRVVTCDLSCRCCGLRTVTVDFLRDHYEQLATEIVK